MRMASASSSSVSRTDRFPHAATSKVSLSQNSKRKSRILRSYSSESAALSQRNQSVEGDTAQLDQQEEHSGLLTRLSLMMSSIQHQSSERGSIMTLRVVKQLTFSLTTLIRLVLRKDSKVLLSLIRDSLALIQFSKFPNIKQELI